MNNRALILGTILNGKYRIERIVGEGGFGITYQATDLLIDETVAIKEYFPSTLASRDTTDELTTELTIITGNNFVSFENGLSKFEKEASNLAKLQNIKGIVKVKNFFRENNTGYMVMEYIDGMSLSEYLKTVGGKLEYSQVLSMMEPIMNALTQVHKAGIVHRDISPDNIMVTKDNQLKLIDFGAARFVGNEDEKSLTIMLKEGYAPPEQYRSDAKQGPWTDVYALCATMYRMITGQVPVDSLSRVLDKDTLKPISKYADIPKYVEMAFIKGLDTNINKRFMCVENLFDYIKKYKFIEKNLYFSVVILSVIILSIFCMIISPLINEKNNETINSIENETLIDDNVELETIEVESVDVELIEEINVPKELSDEELIEHVLEYTKMDFLELEELSEFELEFSDYISNSNIVIDDFDGNGINEICALLYSTEFYEYEGESYETKKLHLFYSDGYNKNVFLMSNNYLAIKDNIENSSNISVYDCKGIKSIQFGKQKQLELVYLEGNLLDSLLKSIVFSIEEEKITPYLEDVFIYEGMSGDACIMDTSTYLLKDGKRKYLEKEVFYLDEQYYEYEIEEHEIKKFKFDNFDEEIRNAQCEILTYTLVEPFGIFELEQGELSMNNAFISDNDKLYINFSVPFWIKNNGIPFVTQNIIAVFSIKDEMLSFIGAMPGEVSPDGFYPCGKSALSEEEVMDMCCNYVRNNGNTSFGFDISRYGNLIKFRAYSDMGTHISTFLWITVDVCTGSAVDSEGYVIDLTY